MSFCKNCGQELNPRASFCINCGTPVEKIVENVASEPPKAEPAVSEPIQENVAVATEIVQNASVEEATPDNATNSQNNEYIAPQNSTQPEVRPAPQPVPQAAVKPGKVVTKIIRERDLPERFKPLGAWSYFWLSVLYNIPIVGFIFLIIFSFSDNINKRNFTRSFWIPFFLVLILCAAYLVLMLVGVFSTGLLSAIFDKIKV